MFVTKILLGITLLASMTGCVTLPDNLKSPTNTDRAIIGINVTQEAPIGLFSNDPDTVLFVKVTGDGAVKDMPLIQSNFAKGGNVYLVDAEPGTYAVVGARWTKTSASGIPSYFASVYDVDAYNKLKIEVKPGSLAYIGKVVIKDSTSPSESKASLSMAQFLSAMQGSVQYFGKVQTFDNSSAARQGFIQKAQIDFQGTAWENLLK